MRRFFFPTALLAVVLGSPFGQGSSVDISPSYPSDGTITITFTVTPDGQADEVYDFHVLLPPHTRLPEGSGASGPFDEQGEALDGWDAEIRQSRRIVSWYATTKSPEKALSGPTTFVLSIPLTANESTPEWRVTNSASTNPGKGVTQTGEVKGEHGEAITPVAFLGITGPDVVTPGTLATYTVDAAVEASVVMPYTVRATLSLDPNDPEFVNPNDPVPAEWGLRMSTNSPDGTVTIGPSTIQATYHGDMRNVLVLDFPDDPSWIGRTIHLQAEFADGTTTVVKTVQVAAELPPEDS